MATKCGHFWHGLERGDFFFAARRFEFHKNWDDNNDANDADDDFNAEEPTGVENEGADSAADADELVSEAASNDDISAFGPRHKTWDEAATDMVEFVEVKLDGDTENANTEEKDAADRRINSPDKVNPASDGEIDIGELVDQNMVFAPPSRFAIVGIVPPAGAGSVEGVT